MCPDEDSSRLQGFVRHQEQSDRGNPSTTKGVERLLDMEERQQHHLQEETGTTNQRGPGEEDDGGGR